MIQIIVEVNYNGENYQTNIVAPKGITCEKVKLLAEDQILKQWGN
jgi:hypothetical protein